MLSIAVLGTGPSSLVATLKLIELGIKPVVLDLGFDLNYKNTLDTNLISQLKWKRLKLWKGSNHSYIQPLDKNLKYSRDCPKPSFGFGGHSRVWGATVNKILLEDFLEGNNPYDLLLEDFQLVDSILFSSSEEFFGNLGKFSPENNLKSSFMAIPSNIAVNFKKNETSSCKYSRTCLSYCPNDAIWTSSKIFQSLIRDRKIEYIPNVYIKHLKISELGITVSGLDLKSRSNFSNTYRKLFLGGGAISTSTLLVRSRIIDNLEVNDSVTRFGLLLDFRISRLFPTNTGTLLSKLWITDRKRTLLCQLYEPKDSFFSRLESLFPRISNELKRYQDSRLFMRIIPLILYGSTQLSGSISITYRNKLTQLSTHYSLFAKLRNFVATQKIRWFFLQKGLLMLPLSFSKVGAGYHYGSSLKKGKHLNSNGELINCPNLVPIDSSSLLDVPTGGIVYSAMVNAASIVRKTMF
jgi:ferredoxin